MYSIRSLDVSSCAKLMGAIYGCLALMVLPPARPCERILVSAARIQSSALLGPLAGASRGSRPHRLRVDRVSYGSADRVGL